jgi:hypothetical protein
MACLNCGKPTRLMKNGIALLYCDNLCNAEFHNHKKKANLEIKINDISLIKNRLIYLKCEYDLIIAKIKELLNRRSI